MLLGTWLVMVTLCVVSFVRSFVRIVCGLRRVLVGKNSVWLKCLLRLGLSLVR